MLLVLAVAGIAGLAKVGAGPSLGWLYAMCVLYCVVYLVAGTMYLERSGWVLVYNVNSLSTWLGHRDSNLYTLSTWGQTQLVPTWEQPKRRPVVRVALVDLRHRVVVETTVLDSLRANVIAPLAVHGCGLTCLVLHRPSGYSETEHKVGIVNMPTYVLSQTRDAASFRVGADPGSSATERLQSRTV